MRPTINDQIKNASHAYILPLARSAMNRRYAVYLQPNGGGGLDVLWPSSMENWKAEAAGLFGLKHSKRAGLPAFHFHYRGCGFSAMDAIRRDLHSVNSSLVVLSIDGNAPSHAL